MNVKSATLEGLTLTLTLDGIPSRQEAARLVHGFKPGEYTLKRTGKRRSLDANAYFHVLVGKIAETMGLGFEEVKTNLVTEYGSIARDSAGAMVGFKLPATADATAIYRYVKQFDTRYEFGQRFNCYIVFKHTHDLDSREMARLIDGTIQEAKQLGIETLTPDELAKLEGLEGYA